MEGEDRPQPRLRCPRCQSMDTKFSYFNNYNKSQPRHFCKTCKRYWTHGGTFRNIPIGGGVRKGRRSNSASSATSSGSHGEIFRVAISSPPLSVGSGAGGLNNFSGGRFQFATQYLSHRQPPANNPGQLVFTRVNHLSLVGGLRDGLNPCIVNPVGRAQLQSRRYPISQMYQVPISLTGGTTLWNRPIMTAPAFATATTNNLPRAPNVVMNCDNSGSVIGGSSNSSSISWFRQLPRYGPFP